MLITYSPKKRKIEEKEDETQTQGSALELSRLDASN